MFAMPIYGKPHPPKKKHTHTLKNLLLQNHESFKTGSWYIASGLKVNKVCSKDDPRITLEVLLQGQICFPIQMPPHTFVWGKPHTFVWGKC